MSPNHSQGVDAEWDAASEAEKTEQQAKRLRLLQRVKFFLDGANEHNAFFYDSDGNPTEIARKLAEEGWDIIKSAAGCSEAFQPLDQSVSFKGLHRYFEPANFITNINKVLPSCPEIDSFVTKKIYSKEGNFGKIAPALRRTFQVGLRHIWAEMDHIAGPRQNVESFISSTIWPISDQPEDQRAHARKAHSF